MYPPGTAKALICGELTTLKRQSRFGRPAYRATDIPTVFTYCWICESGYKPPDSFSNFGWSCCPIWSSLVSLMVQPPVTNVATKRRRGKTTTANLVAQCGMSNGPYRSRTDTPLRELDFESSASANSAKGPWCS